MALVITILTKFLEKIINQHGLENTDFRWAFLSKILGNKYELEILSKLSMQSYQLFISVNINLKIQVGKLGMFNFPKGTYIYTGSAMKNIDARIKRHLSKYKKSHWHIDYLLRNNQTNITKVIKSELNECDLNSDIKGKIIAIGFGSSDCRNNCKSHLKYIDHQWNIFSF